MTFLIHLKSVFSVWTGFFKDFSLTCPNDCVIDIYSSKETQEAAESGGVRNAEPSGLSTRSAAVRGARIQRGDRVQSQLRLRWTQVHATWSTGNTAR